MSKYPGVITPAILAKHAHISDEEVRRDIAETETEIVEGEAAACAYDTIASLGTSLPHERKLAAFHASAKRSTNNDRRAFIDYLTRVLEAREREGAHV